MAEKRGRELRTPRQALLLAHPQNIGIQRVSGTASSSPCISCKEVLDPKKASSSVSAGGSLISSLREIGPFTIRPIWAIRLLGLMTVGVTDGRGVMPSGPPTRTVAVAARRETIVLFPCRVWPPDPGTPWQDQWPNESGSVPSPLQVEYRHLAKGLASPDTTAKRS